MATPCVRKIGGSAGLCLGLAFILFLALSSIPAQAHHPSTGARADGLAIPNLTHGQMAVIADNAAAIQDLAGRRVRTDPVFRRLQNFAALQRTYCLWGLVPGSLADEDSPFNECTHAYLAGLMALLLHMQAMPGEQAAVGALVGRIELEMLRRQASLTLCRYSGEAFSTAEVVLPRWSEVPFHPPSLLAFAGVAVVLAGSMSLLVMPRRRSHPRDAASDGNGGPA